MSSNLKPLKNTINRIVKQLNVNHQRINYQSYYRLLQGALPNNWRNSVALVDIESGVWYLGVRSQQEAYLLRFLTPEIEQYLAQKLPNPPKVAIHTDPTLWSQNQRQITPVIHIPRQYYSEEESRKILNEFFTRLPNRL